MLLFEVYRTNPCFYMKVAIISIRSRTIKEKLASTNVILEFSNHQEFDLKSHDDTILCIFYFI